MIADGDVHFPPTSLGGRGGAHTDPSIGAPVLHGVCDQVLHGGSKRGRVTDHRRQIRGDFTLNMDVTGTEQRQRGVER
jgi:hypothetical protein